jgi:GTP-binding protein
MNNRYQATSYFTSAYAIEQLPPDQGWEVAFAGRSNVGKSSALNVLTRQKSLARTGKTPGRTQMINFFRVEPDRYLVDLPGYGYAKAPRAARQNWRKTVESYLNGRHALRGLFLLMDIRHPLTELDRQMLVWCRDRGLPAHILLTKADKLKRGPGAAVFQQVRQALARDCGRVSVQLFSALKRVGVDEAYVKLDQWLGYDESLEYRSGG